MAIQPIDSGSIHGVQVRVGQGPGQTKFLAYRKHGGRRATLAKAREIEASMFRQASPRGRCKGVLQTNNASGLAGIRLEWRGYGGEMAYLYVVGNYTDALGRSRAFAYSVDKHGFEGALSRGLDKRESHGAPHVAVGAAIKALRAHYIAITK
jgi:hypothetical protein